MPRKSPIVVLVGRPNVGKSTLFNRMTGSRRAIVAPIAGTTRDALARPVEWADTSFQLFDTGGLFGASEDPLHELVVQQGQRAIADADLLVFLVDGREGLVSGDERIAQELRATGRPVLLAINKTDDKRSRASALEFFQLGFDPVFEISAEHGTGVFELLDEIVRRLGDLGTRGLGTRDPQSLNAQSLGPQSPVPEVSDEELRIAIVGRPIVIIANKWDLVKTADHKFVETFDDTLRQGMRFLDYAPILHVSALTGERMTRVLETIDKVAAARRMRVATPALNRFLEEVT